MISPQETLLSSARRTSTFRNCCKTPSITSRISPTYRTFSTVIWARERLRSRPRPAKRWSSSSLASTPFVKRSRRSGPISTRRHMSSFPSSSIEVGRAIVLCVVARLILLCRRNRFERSLLHLSTRQQEPQALAEVSVSASSLLVCMTKLGFETDNDSVITEIDPAEAVFAETSKLARPVLRSPR